MGMGTVLGRIFGTEKAMEAAVEGVSKGLDALVYTDEEKATEAAKDRAEARSMLVKWLETTSGQHLARRSIALSITTIWLLQYIFAWAVSIAAIWAADARDQLNAAAEMTTTHADGMTGAVMLILAFYFAAPHMDKVVNTALTRFGGK